MNNIITQYVRRGLQRRKVGLVVATKKDGRVRIGWSLCCKKDTFNPKMALDIALGRALKNTPMGLFPSSIAGDVEAMNVRAMKYFKT